MHCGYSEEDAIINNDTLAHVDHVAVRYINLYFAK
jgi:hypothetical protein